MIFTCTSFLTFITPCERKDAVFVAFPIVIIFLFNITRKTACSDVFLKIVFSIVEVAMAIQGQFGECVDYMEVGNFDSKTTL